MSEILTNSKQLDSLDSILRKKYGDRYYGFKGNNKLEKIDWVSSGYYGIDYVFGKGVPKGKLIQLTGWESVGKSLLAQQIAARFVSLQKIVFWIEAGEAAFDRDFASSLGLDVDSIGFLKAKTAEEAAEAIRDILKSGIVDLIVVDSIA